MYRMVTIANSDVLYTWILLRVNLVFPTTTMWSDGYVNQPNCGDYFIMYIYIVTMLYTFNI